MKRLLAFLCVTILLISLFSPMVSAASIKLIPTKIPKSFPVIKQDPSFTVVTFWQALTGRYATLITDICNWYNATEGKTKKIYVKPIFQGDYDAITVKVQATIQSGNKKDLPDLVQLSAQGAFSVKESKDILYMEDLMNADKSFTIRDKLNKNGMWACAYKGKQLGMPLSNSMIMMHYNVPAFKAVGLDPNNPPKTLAEFADASAKLLIQGSGKKPLRHGSALKLDFYPLSTLIPRQKGGTAFQFDMEDGHQGVPKKYICAEDGTLKAALTEWKKALDTKSVDFSTTNARASFEQGLSAMTMVSMVSFDTVETYMNGNPKKRFEHWMARIPTVNANDSVGEAIGGNAVYMFNKGDERKKNATWQFVKFLASVDVSAYWYANAGYYPLNTDAINTQYVQDELKSVPAKQICLQVRANSVNSYKFQEPWIPSLAVYGATVGDQVALMAQGKQTIDQTVAAIAKKANSILKTYWDTNK